MLFLFSFDKNKNNCFFVFLERNIQYVSFRMNLYKTFVLKSPLYGSSNDILTDTLSISDYPINSLLKNTRSISDIDRILDEYVDSMIVKNWKIKMIM
jgi:hypothetical protein